MQTLDDFEIEEVKEKEVKEVFDQTIPPAKNIMSKLISAIAEELDIITDFMVKVIAADFQKMNDVDELISFLGARMNQEQAAQWSICYFRNLLPYYNYTEATKKCLFFYLQLRSPHTNIPLGESNLPVEIHNCIKQFQYSNRDDEFYKRIE